MRENLTRTPSTSSRQAVSVFRLAVNRIAACGLTQLSTQYNIGAFNSQELRLMPCWFSTLRRRFHRL